MNTSASLLGTRASARLQPRAGDVVLRHRQPYLVEVAADDVAETVRARQCGEIRADGTGDVVDGGTRVARSEFGRPMIGHRISGRLLQCIRGQQQALGITKFAHRFAPAGDRLDQRGLMWRVPLGQLLDVTEHRVGLQRKRISKRQCAATGIGTQIRNVVDREVVAHGYNCNDVEFEEIVSQQISGRGNPGGCGRGCGRRSRLYGNIGDTARLDPTLGQSGSSTTPTEAAAQPSDDFDAARTQLESLAVKGRAPKTGYARDEFGQSWTDDVNVDYGHNGCDTRNDILRRDLTVVTYRPGTRDCVVVTGVLADPYSGKTIDFVRGEKTSTAVQIDHVVAMSDAWQKGAAQWDKC